MTMERTGGPTSPFTPMGSAGRLQSCRGHRRRAGARRCGPSPDPSGRADEPRDCGPSAFAVGLVGGATVGGVIEASHLPRLEGPAFDAIRERVPNGSSAVVVISTASVHAMSEALAGAAETFDGYRSGRRRTPSCDPRPPPRRQARRRGSEARDSCAITPSRRPSRTRSPWTPASTTTRSRSSASPAATSCCVGPPPCSGRNRRRRAARGDDPRHCVGRHRDAER